MLNIAFYATALLSIGLPILTAFALSLFHRPTIQETTLIQCLSLLLLGMFLSALATLNFSLSFLIGILAAPLTFVRALNRKPLAVVLSIFLSFLNPVGVIGTATRYWGKDVVDVLVQAAEGWHIWGLWTQVVVWLVWWPAWFAGAVVVSGPLFA